MYAEIEKPLDINEILEEVHSLRIGKSLKYYPTVGSTNDIAYHLAEAGEDEGTIVIADEQTAGKGRLDRKWSSARFKGVYASLILRPEMHALFASRFTMLASVSAVRAIQEVAHIRAQIKWPNDIMINERKAGGILAEIKVMENIIKFVIVGIGINVNHLEGDFPGDLAAIATSLLIESSLPVSRERFVTRLLSNIDSMYPKALLDDFSSIIDEWKELSPCHENCAVLVKNGDRSYRGITKGITESGELIVEVESGENIIVSFGDLIQITRDPHASCH